MRLLGDTGNREEALRQQALLRSRGIPSHLQSNRGRFQAKHLLWVSLDDQYEDALAVLSDPEHVVTAPVDIAEYEATLARLDQNVLLKYLALALLATVSLIAAAALLYLRSHS